MARRMRNPVPAQKFSGKYEHRTITGGIGHNLPQEAPQAFAQAIVDVRFKLGEDFPERRFSQAVRSLCAAVKISSIGTRACGSSDVLCHGP